MFVPVNAPKFNRSWFPVSVHRQRRSNGEWVRRFGCHSFLMHGHLLRGETCPRCSACGVDMTVEQILLHCVSFAIACDHSFKMTTVTSQCFKRSWSQKLQYTSCAWRGFSSLAESQKINAFIRRSAHCGSVPPNLPNFEEICRSADDKLFLSIISNQSCTVSLTSTTIYRITNYNLLRGFPNLKILARVNYLNNCNFVTRMLYANL